MMNNWKRTFDLVAAKAIYHLHCLVQFDRKLSRIETKPGQKRDEVMDTVCTEPFAVLKRGNVYNVKDVFNYYTSILKSKGVEIPQRY